MKHVWSGDCDLGDGSLQKLYKEYVGAREFVNSVGFGQRKGKLLEDLSKILIDLESEKSFLDLGEKES